MFHLWCGLELSLELGVRRTGFFIHALLLVLRLETRHVPSWLYYLKFIKRMWD